jgi:succinyl-CoA synthetase alpha subunit
MGHAGAIVSGSGTGTAESKIAALNDAGVPVGDTPEEVAETVADLLS